VLSAWLVVATALPFKGMAAFPEGTASGVRASVVQGRPVSRRPLEEPKPYVWLSPIEIRALPIAGDAGCDARCAAAWTLLRQAASVAPARPSLWDQDETTGNFVLAKALVAVRVNDLSLAQELSRQIVSLLQSAIGTEFGARSLAVGRKLAAYVVSAEVIGLSRIEPNFDELVFRPWLRSLLDENLDGFTLRSCHEIRPNNWGTHCGASRVAVASYLDDRSELERAAQVFRGYLGDRQSHAAFEYHGDAFTWMSDPTCPRPRSDCNPRPVNPRGATLDGHNVDGVMVDDQRRAGPFRWPPPYTIYSYGALEGSVVQAAMLHRLGFDSWQWGDEALRRAVEWLFDGTDGKEKWDTCAEPNKRYILDLIDHAYGADFLDRMDCSPEPSEPGRNIAWTSWTHQR
jgi:hypothetical protein